MKELHGLDVEFLADGELHIDDGDARVLLFQVFRELLFNVAKHSGARSAVADVQEVDSKVAVTISDSGRGFDADEVERAGRERPTVGLTSVRQRVNLLGGSLRIESQPDRGTRVTVTIPRTPQVGA